MGDSNKSTREKQKGHNINTTLAMNASAGPVSSFKALIYYK